VHSRLPRLTQQKSNTGIRELRGFVEKLIFLWGVVLPNGVNAQSGYFAAPSLSLAGVYDDNLFSSISQPEQDRFLRLSPGIEAGYRSAPLTFKGTYTLDAEAYANHPELDSSRARAQASMDLQYRPTRLLTLAAEGSYTKTQRPDELNVDTGLDIGRVRAERSFIGPSASFRFDPATVGTAAYRFTRDKLVDGIGTDTHTATLGVDRRITPRTTASVGYAVHRFVFEGEERTTSLVFTFGGTHEFTPRTTVTVLGGPRVSEGSIDPEISVSLRRTLKRGSLSFDYARTQSTVIGQAGAVDTRSLRATAEYSFGPSLEIRAAPGYQSSTRGGFRTDVYRVNLETRYRITKSLSLFGSYEFGLQRGILDAPGDEEIARNVVLLGIVLASPSPIGPRRGARAKDGAVVPSRTDSESQTNGPAPSPDVEARSQMNVVPHGPGSR
jgi:hypothetical protein